MRLDPKLVHPSIFKATDSVVWSGNLYTGENAKAGAAHQAVWFKEYGKGCLLTVALAAAAILGSIQIANFMEKPWKGFFVLAVFIASLGAGGYALHRNMRSMAVPELAALLPSLDLTEAQRAYAETVVALERTGHSRSQIEETMVALNALLDEETRLLEARERLSGVTKADEPTGLDAERARLAERAAAAQDGAAREAFEQSLSLLDERRALFGNGDAHLERVDAHLELLRQAVLSTRDAARRLGSASADTAPDLSTDTLRTAVANARAQTQATEVALAELRAI